MSIRIFPFLLINGALFGASCSTGVTKSHMTAGAESDTSYIGSTMVLRSNKIPDSVFQMIHLRHLVISGMDCDYSPHPDCWTISEIPAKIKNLKELTSLRLTLSVIQRIPDELTELQHLAVLDLTDGALSGCDLGNIAKLRNLEYLYLYGCGLSKLPPDLGNLTNLKELALLGNHFSVAEQKRIRNALPGCVIEF